MGLIDRDEVSYASFRTDAADRWRIEVEATSLAYTVFAGPTPLEAPARFSVPSGRQPMPERWWFGPWYQSGHANRVPLERPSIEWRVLAEVLSPFWRFINAPASSATTERRGVLLAHEWIDMVSTARPRSWNIAVRARSDSSWPWSSPRAR